MTVEPVTAADRLLAPLWRAARWGARSLGHLVVVAGLGIAASVMLMPLFGYRTFVVASGSMHPFLDVGDAVVFRAGGDRGVGVGSVIIFRERTAVMTTHRVVAVTEANGTRLYQTKGDANKTPDPDPVPAGAVYGTYASRLPQGGRLIALVNSHSGHALVLAAIAGVIVWELPFLLRRSPFPRSRPVRRGADARLGPGAHPQ
jgi:signal peptidase I